MAASPAMANTSAASAEVPAQVRDADGASVSGGDATFKQLFAQWEALDGGTESAPAPVASISIPTRMPLDSGRVSSGYGMRTHPITGGRRGHKGIDIAAPTGTPIYATGDGIVSRANSSRTYGLVVYMNHGAELQTRFAHMSRIAVANGQRVRKGDIIGYVGSTGRSTGPHLHYEVRVSGRSVNPRPYMVESTSRQAHALEAGEGGRGGD